MTTTYDMRLPQFLHDYLACNEGDFAPLKLHMPCAVTATASALGRRVFLNQGGTSLFTSDYLLIVGAPGTGKSRAIKKMAGYLRQAGYRNFAPSKATLPQLFKELERFQNGNDVSAKGKGGSFSLNSVPFSADAEMLIAADELGTFLSYGENSKEFIALLNQVYDGEDLFQYKTVTSVSVELERVLINVAAGTTPKDFDAMFGGGVAAGGIMSRFLIVSTFQEAEKRFEPITPAPELVERVVVGLRRSLELLGEMSYTSEGFALARAIHEQPTLNPEGTLQHFYARRDVRRKKLAMIMAAMRGCLVISADDVTIAHTMICYHEMHLPKVLGEYGGAMNAGTAQMVMHALYTAGRPMKSRELMMVVNTEVNHENNLGQVLQKLAAAGKIQQTELGGYLPVSPVGRYKVDRFVDWKVLQGILPADEIAALLCFHD